MRLPLPLVLLSDRRLEISAVPDLALVSDLTLSSHQTLGAVCCLLLVVSTVALSYPFVFFSNGRVEIGAVTRSKSRSHLTLSTARCLQNLSSCQHRGATVLISGIKYAEKPLLTSMVKIKYPAANKRMPKYPQKYILN